MNASQHWFTTGKVHSFLQTICKRMYGSTRSFKFPADTRFGGKLLQIKQFLDMKLALQELCRSDKYSEYEFENDVYAPRILGNADAAAVADASAASQASAVVTANPTGDVWELMERITELANCASVWSAGLGE